MLVHARPHGPRGPDRALLRYVGAAATARIPDAGATVGLVLLVTERGSMGGAAGLLAVCLNLPHLLGPFLARRLDAVSDGRPFIAVCCVGYGVALAGAAVAIGRLPLLVPLVLVVLAGVCGPILTGGLSSQLSVMVGADEGVLRRAQGWDALTYGVSGSAGPAIVAAIAVRSALLSVLALAAMAALGGFLVMLLPPARKQPSGTVQDAQGIAGILKQIWQRGGLRRATFATIATSFVAGSIAILAVGRSLELGGGASQGALLAALFGLGNLVGSALVTAFPLRANPDRSNVLLAGVMGFAFVGCGFAPTVVASAVAFAVAGLINGPFFAATLAARTTYAPSSGQAQVFVAMAALKIGASAAGAGLAGTVGISYASVALVAGGALVVAVSGSLILDMRRATRH